MPEYDFVEDRRKALSALLQYAEYEALELKETGLAEIIQAAHRSMAPSVVAGQIGDLRVLGNKFQS